MFITLLPIHKNKSRSISQIVRQELLLRKQLFHALHKCIFKLKIGGTHYSLGLLRIGNNYHFQILSKMPLCFAWISNNKGIENFYVSRNRQYVSLTC